MDPVDRDLNRYLTQCDREAKWNKFEEKVFDESYAKLNNGEAVQLGDVMYTKAEILEECLDREGETTVFKLLAQIKSTNDLKLLELINLVQTTLLEWIKTNATELAKTQERINQEL